MRNVVFKLMLVGLAAAGGVVVWQRRNETPATPPYPRPSEPFMDPAPQAAVTTPAVDAGHGRAAEPVTQVGTADMVTRTPELGDDQPIAAPEENADTDEIEVMGTGAEGTTTEPEVRGGPAADAGEVAAERAKDGRSDPGPLPAPPHGPLMTAPQGPADDLKRINGVGPQLERTLNEQGITTYAQLASLTEQQIDDLQARLPQFPGRVRRDNWVEQARRLHGN